MKASVPGLNRKARNPKFIRGIPRLVVPKKIPKAPTIPMGPVTPSMKAADHTQREDLSNSGYHSSVAPNRGSKPPKISFGNF